MPTKIQLRVETEEKQNLADEVPPLDTITTRKDITIVGYSPNLLKNATGEVLTMIIKVSYKTLTHDYRGSVGVMVFLMPLSTIFQLYRGSQFYWWRKLEKTTDLSHATGNFYHILLYRVHLALSGVRTHNFSDARH